MIKARRWRMLAKQNVVCEDFDYDEKALQPREIAVRVDCSAISPGTECANYLALDPDVLVPGKWCSYPWTPGYSSCGHIIGVGSGVKDYKLGDGVVGFTRHASHWTVNVDQYVVPLDPRLKPEQASYLRLLSIACTAVQIMQQDTLPTVGVWGLGMIGNLVAQFLQRAGGRVVGIDPVAERRALAGQCGIQETLDPTAADFRDRVNQLTRNEGFDITADTTGSAPVTIAMPGFTRMRGQMLLMTHWRSQPVLDATPFMRDVLCRGITVHGGHENGPGLSPGADRNALQRRKWMKLQHEIATGGIQVAPLISHVIQPSQCKEAYEGLSFDRQKWWGVVVDWRD